MKTPQSSSSSQRARDTEVAAAVLQERVGNGNTSTMSNNFSHSNDNKSTHEVVQQQSGGQDASERAPLLVDTTRNNKPPRNPNHGRTRSVDFAGRQPPVDLRPMAPGRHHQRTRSLEEWASLFGIEGIRGAGDNDEIHPREDKHRKRQHHTPQRSPENEESQSTADTSSNGIPSLPLHYSPSAAKNRKHVRLDSIVEAELDENDYESDEPLQQPADHQSIQQQQQMAWFSAAAMGDSETSMDVDVDGAGAQTLYTSPRMSGYDADNQSVGSNGSSSTVYSLPQHLTNSGGRYSYTTNSSVAAPDDLSSVDDKSIAEGSLLDYSHSRSGSLSSERLAKFEREQEIMFQQKRTSIQRELSNVLERNAIKTHREKQEFINTYMVELEKERAKLVAQWREEWEKEEEHLRQRDPKRKLFRALYNKIGQCLDALMYFFSSFEVFISNMPLTIAALALSWVSMGCVWFKFMEEQIDDCHHVHFYSPQCTFPEFPGCFECNLENKWYILGVNFHYFCSIVSFTFCSMIMLKVIIAWDVVLDELGNPTTSTPAGVFCIAMVCVFAGRGPVGEMVVLITATFHFVLAFWFLYMAVFKYHLYPDPGWFPNTVGISYAAVKSFLYFPFYGEILMILCLTFFFGVFFVSALRVATNPKIAAPICWFMLSAPSITLYAVTLMAQPAEADEVAMANNPELKGHFVDFLQSYYLPLHHFLFACSLIGVCSAIHGVLSRWEKFKEKPFSPAHVAFCAPTLSHTNAIQSYRASIEALSSFPPHGWFRTAIDIYWCTFLFTGTIVNLIFTYKFLRRLPEWTKVDVADEEAPPAPYETMTHEMLDDRGAHETMMAQPFVSPAVLEANEAGALVRVRRGTEDYRRYGPFIRTRKVTARGFDPSMNDTELRQERAALLEWVAKTAPRKRNRTMSIPGVLHLRDKAGRGVYGTFVGGDGGVNGANDGGDIGDQRDVRRTNSKHTRARTSVDGFW
ncbi:expressed unknown protein [Seminavis robusta]|uniref:Uncharacterized protein n=1 Tax=Seminavis robusta TaxID=568900 RepID=A0A9N8DUA0_9STRA|nr:expressed unknown protein [Seminavis robusta]|eukprot:Sro295_g110430.1 n/a (972) ;mRNA; f:28369-31912